MCVAYPRRRSFLSSAANRSLRLKMPSIASVTVRAPIPMGSDLITGSDVFDGPQYHSGYFFFENVFYNDMRDPSNVDYSKYAPSFHS